MATFDLGETGDGDPTDKILPLPLYDGMFSGTEFTARMCGDALSEQETG